MNNRGSRSLLISNFGLKQTVFNASPEPISKGFQKFEKV